MSLHDPHPLFLAAAAALLAGACAVAPSRADTPEPSVFTHPPAAGEPLLYARDGSVVDPATSPAQERGAPARRDVGGDSGRMHLLELYQQVIDERDDLGREVHALRADVEAQTLALEHSRAQASALEARVRELEAQVARLGAENQDLAARLTTAQIRRLQAERLLLEHKLALQKEREAQAAAQAAQEQEQP
jgi:hypothetical protein